MKLTVVKDGKPVSADVVPSTAGTHRRFVLPDWARREMAWLDNRVAALEADKPPSSSSVTAPDEPKAQRARRS